ncbi:MAG: DUF1223 domain-containing protein [Hyphomonadaceae bacterium]
MLHGMIARFLALVLIALAATAVDARAQDQGRRATAVVELYTSQGCTQCPRANRLLGAFSREDGVLALTFPVGIWDYLGWHDTFARPEFADRQRIYSRTMRVRGRFTPQLVYNGARQVSASDWDEARALFNTQRQQGWPAGAPDVTIAMLRNNTRTRVTVGSGPAGSNADVWLLAYEPGPITVVITGGVNVNRSIAHYNLVRWIERLDSWNGTSAWFERSRCQPECAVIVQEPNGGRILAAAYTYRPGRH